MALLEAVTAGAMLAIARVSDVDFVKLAVHPVAVEFTFRHATRYTLIHFPSHVLSSSITVFPFFRKIS